MLLLPGLLSLALSIGAAAQVTTTENYQPQTARGAAVAVIVNRWAAHVQQTYNVSPTTWANGMATTFAKAKVPDLQNAGRQPTYDAMMAAALGRAGADLAPPPNTSSLNANIMATGDRTKNLLYTMTKPCRLVDTRIVGERLAAGTVRTFTANGNLVYQGGNAGGCNLVEASAVVLNVTVVYPDSAGYLTVFPFQGTRPLASSLNYGASAIVGNEIIAQVSEDFSGYFSVYSFAGADVVIDAAGYFSPARSEPLDCVVDESALVGVAANGGTASAITAACPTGYTATGGGCLSVDSYASINGVYFHSFGPNAQGAYECSARNRDTNPQRIRARLTCCRMPINPL